MSSHDSDKAAHLHKELHSHMPSDPALRLKALETGEASAGEVTANDGRRWLIRGDVVRDGDGDVVGAIEVGVVDRCPRTDQQDRHGPQSSVARWRPGTRPDLTV